MYLDMYPVYQGQALRIPDLNNLKTFIFVCGNPSLHKFRKKSPCHTRIKKRARTNCPGHLEPRNGRSSATQPAKTRATLSDESPKKRDRRRRIPRSHVHQTCNRASRRASCCSSLRALHRHYPHPRRRRPHRRRPRPRRRRLRLHRCRLPSHLELCTRAA